MIFKTPEIPAGIRALKAPINFSNPFDIGITGPNLYGTETLCGDWSGDTLLLAQDFAPTEAVQKVLKIHGSKGAWRHNDGDGRYGIGVITNKNICKNLGYIGRNVEIDGKYSLNCGILYGNASFFLKDGNTPPTNGVNASKIVFDFVTAQMSNIRAIVCLGKPAFDGVMGYFNLNADWKRHRDTRISVKRGNFAVFALSHPGQLGLNSRLMNSTNADRLAAVKLDWESVGKAIG